MGRKFKVQCLQHNKGGQQTQHPYNKQLNFHGVK